MGKTMKRDRKTSGERDAPQKYTSKWTRGRKEGKSIFNISFQSNVNNLRSLCFLLLLFIYLPSFSAASLWNFWLSLSLFLYLFFLYTRLFHEKQNWHALLTPSECLNTALIFICRPRRSRDKIKRESKGKFATLDHDLREKVLTFYFHIFSNMVCVMEAKKTKQQQTKKLWIQPDFLKKTTQNNSLDVIRPAFACFYTSFI